MTKALRLTDMVSAGDVSALVGLTGMQGCWRSCDEKNAGVPAIEVSLEGEEATARVYGFADGGLVDWGAASTRALLSEGPGSPQVAGFVVRFPFGDAEAHLQINFKIGVAVAGIFVRGGGASGRPRALFWREFLARGEPITEPAGSLSSPRPESLSHRLLHGAAVDFSTAAIEGRWRCTNAKSRGIPEIVVEPGDGNVVLRVWGRAEDGGLHDWGEVVAETHGAVEEDDQLSSCALATYEFDFMDCEVQVRQNKGILAVTTFNRFKDGSDRFDYVTRELYYREAR